MSVEAWSAAAGGGVVALVAFCCERAVRRLPWSRVEEVEHRPLRQRMTFSLEHADGIVTWCVLIGSAALGATCWGLLAILGELGGWGGYEWLRPAFAAAWAAALAWGVPEVVARRWPMPIVGFWIPLVGALVGKSPTAASPANGEYSEAEPPSPEEEAEHTDEEAREFYRSVLRLQNVDASEVMTPRIKVVAVRDADTVEAVLRVAVQCGHSRLPVFHETRDHIVGVLYVKDLLRRIREPDWQSASVRDLMREPFFVPETKSCHDLLEEFQRRKVHLGIVVDEYGGTDGIVTIEDIIEEILGEIRDEHDLEEEHSYRRVSENSLEADATLRIEELNDALNVNLPEDEDFDTVGGFVNFSLGRVPAKGETFERDSVRFTVLESDQRRVKRVRVENMDGEP